MAVLTWDETGEKLYETGVKKAVLYVLDSNNEYKPGVAWNGISSIQESPSGAEPNDIYADDLNFYFLILCQMFVRLICLLKNLMLATEWLKQLMV